MLAQAPNERVDWYSHCAALRNPGLARKGARLPINFERRHSAQLCPPQKARSPITVILFEHRKSVTPLNAVPAAENPWTIA